LLELLTGWDGGKTGLVKRIGPAGRWGLDIDLFGLVRVVIYQDDITLFQVGCFQQKKLLG
jgi:hypothetical protein